MKVDFTNKRFSRLVALRRENRADHRTYWTCRCDCGRIHSVRGSHLKHGKIRSCGCLHREMLSTQTRTHGMTGSPEWKSWAHMRSRCNNPDDPSYPDYGGRGIRVCKRWDGFPSFFKDMGFKPSRGHSIHRVNNDDNYSPNNCRWATKLEQAQNKRNNRFLTFQGKTLCMAEWGRVMGFGTSVISQRLRYGWTVERAVGTPV